MKKNQFPEGWDEKRVQQVLAHYENQTEDEAVVEDEAFFANSNQTTMVIPKELVPVVRDLIAKHQEKNAGNKRPSRRG